MKANAKHFKLVHPVSNDNHHGPSPRLKKHLLKQVELSEKYFSGNSFNRNERNRHSLALHINKLILSELELEPLFEMISSALWEQVRHEFISLSVLDHDKSMERLRCLDTPIYRGRYKIGLNIPVFIKVFDPSMETKQFHFLQREQISTVDPSGLAEILLQEGICSVCQIPLVSKGRTLGILSLGSCEENHFTADRLDLIAQIIPQVALAVDNGLARHEIRCLRERLMQERPSLKEEVKPVFAATDIIGSSRSLKQVLRQVEKVAPIDATVLLLGETGTGKELIARAIHEHSRRCAQAFVKLNCSAIPMGLMESELFGHERGAFTGAVQRKPGRFELANAGSLFLDEIGDLPLEVQPKLLRAIQEREFERLGSNKTIHVDVRLIAATHRDLDKMVLDGEFRSDLFYRLNVFPIRVPALRERKEDIPGLVCYFAQKFAKAIGRRIEHIPASTMDALVAWPWPGNIRELQNLMERSVILSQGPELQVPVAELKTMAGVETCSPVKTLEDVERDHIIQALRECKGVISGPLGVAARLGMKRTTLNYRMKKLGITRERV